MSDLLRETMALREKAWSAVVASPAYAQFVALDAAVQAMGGAPADLANSTTHVNPPLRARVGVAPTYIGRTVHHFVSGQRMSHSERKISHAEAAMQALLKAGRPMQSPELLEAARAEGALIGGDKPIINLTSSLSRSSEIESLRINGTPHWWLTGRPLPEGYAASENASDRFQQSVFDNEEEIDGTAIDKLDL